MNDGEAADAIDLPEFAHALHARDRFVVERQNDDPCVVIDDRSGRPATVELLRVIREANADGWRLDRHTDAGDELHFVPFEGGESA